jgi:hypothetical protein
MMPLTIREILMCLPGMFGCHEGSCPGGGGKSPKERQEIPDKFSGATRFYQNLSSSPETRLYGKKPETSF